MMFAVACLVHAMRDKVEKGKEEEKFCRYEGHDIGNIHVGTCKIIAPYYDLCMLCGKGCQI